MFIVWVLFGSSCGFCVVILWVLYGVILWGHLVGHPVGYVGGQLVGFVRGHIVGFVQGHLVGFVLDHLVGFV